MICDGLEPELIRVLKLSVFKKKYEQAKAIIKKNDDFIFYFGSHFKVAEYKQSQIIMREGEPPTKSKIDSSVYFIAEGKVQLYQTSLAKGVSHELDNKSSFGEYEYFREEKKRHLNAKAISEKVVCYTLSYEVCAKLFPKMIEKEVSDLKRQAERVFNRIIDTLNSKAQGTSKRLPDGEGDSIAHGDNSFELGSRQGGESLMKSPQPKKTISNLGLDSDHKLLGENSLKANNKN